MTASSNGSGAADSGGEAPANTVQVGGWTLSADLSPEAMQQVQGLISGMQNEAGPARQAVERPDRRSNDDEELFGPWIFNFTTAQSVEAGRGRFVTRGLGPFLLGAWVGVGCVMSPHAVRRRLTVPVKLYVRDGTELLRGLSPAARDAVRRASEAARLAGSLDTHVETALAVQAHIQRAGRRARDLLQHAISLPLSLYRSVVPRRTRPCPPVLRPCSMACVCVACKQAAGRYPPRAPKACVAL